jgi:two-component system, sporulation sensor kinase E
MQEIFLFAAAGSHRGEYGVRRTANDMKSAFWNKLIERLDKLDPGSVQAQFLRLASERGLLETIFHALREGILVLDAEGRIVYANRGACRLLGLDEATAPGQPMGRYIREIEWEQPVAAGREGMGADGQPRDRDLVSGAPVPGECIWRRWKIRGRPDGVVMILRDVTQERDHAAEIVESERLNAILMLAAGVAHEIGNPLNSLTIHLQLMDRELRGLPEEKPGRVEGAAGRGARGDRGWTRSCRSS